MDIRLPNGHIIRNVPEGTSKDEVMQKALRAGLATREDFVQRRSPEEYNQIRQDSVERYRQEQAEELNPVTAGLLAAGETVNRFGQGVGDAWARMTGIFIAILLCGHGTARSLDPPR